MATGLPLEPPDTCAAPTAVSLPVGRHAVETGDPSSCVLTEGALDDPVELDETWQATP
jgi:hypothetical protein